MKIRLNTALVSLLTLTLFACAPIEAFAQNSSVSSSTLAADIIARTNTDRAFYHKAALTENTALDAAAQKRADDMLAQQYFAHTAPDGTTPWSWFRQAGYSYTYAGENLAMNFDAAADVEVAWMNSPGHRANILNGNYKHIGIGVAHGIYEGKETTIIVEFFGAHR